MSYIEAMSLLDDLIEDVNVPDNTYNMIALALKKANDSEKRKNEEYAQYVTTRFAIRKQCHESIGLILTWTPAGVIMITGVLPGSISDLVGMKPGDIIIEVNNVRQYNVTDLCDTLRYIDGIVMITTWRIEYTERDEHAHLPTIAQPSHAPPSESEYVPPFQTRPRVNPSRQTPLRRVRAAYNRVMAL